MTAVTPTDRPKSVRNRCEIEVFGSVVYVVTLLFGFFCGCRGFCYRTESDIFLFLYDQERSKAVVTIWFENMPLNCPKLNILVYAKDVSCFNRLITGHYVQLLIDFVPNNGQFWGFDHEFNLSFLY